MVSGQPATDGAGSDRGAGPYGVVTGPTALPSWRSRGISAGWLALLIIGLGAIAAFGIVFVVVVAWAFISSAVG